jgi:hypothetical protein
MIRSAWQRRLAILTLVVAITTPLVAQDGQELDAHYSDEIRAHTTDARFLTPVVEVLPASSSVPTPLDFHGYIAGAEGHLTYAADVHAYMRAVADSSPRVEVFRMGETEEGRERILVVAGSNESIANLDRYREITARLADPRSLTDEEAAELIGRGKAIYWATGGLHSPETGSPEMLMELIYRFAADERPIFNGIRDNLIFMATPVVEVDGRERIIDIMRYRAANPGKAAPDLVYWGKYIAHDNNRDGIGLALTLSRQAIETYLQWHPQVMHDLHESVPFLYIMSGHGPFNSWLDPITTEEWVEMAWTEVRKMNEWNVPGVWTFNFFDGWAANYMIYAAMGRNSVGRFYETFGNSVPETQMREIGEQSQRAWYRMNPPTPKVLWSLRNNTNLMQSALVVGLHNVATNKDRFLDTFYRKGKRAIEKPHLEGPAAWVIPADGPRPLLTRRLINLLQAQTIELSAASEAFEIEASRLPGDSETVQFAAGDVIVRMDQPYSRLADMLLDYQYYNPDDPRPYDDTGWSLGPLFNVDTYRVVDTAVLDVSMTALDAATSNGGISGNGSTLVLTATGEPEVATFRFALADLPMRAAEAEFVVDDTTYPAGSMLLDGVDPEVRRRAANAATELGLQLTGVSAAPEVATHAMPIPRIGLIHTWINTQSEGWWRYALDDAAVPYEYVSTDAIGETDDLKARWDVLIMAPGWGDVTRIVQGARSNQPIAWKTTEITPNLGRIDATDDMTAGIGFDGVGKIQRFVEHGGVIIAATSSIGFLTQTGIAPYVRVDNTPSDMKARGALFKAEITDGLSPITYGYDEHTAVYFSNAPLLRVNAAPRGRRFGDDDDDDDERASGRRGDDTVPGHPPYVDPEKDADGDDEETQEGSEEDSELYFDDGQDLSDRIRLLAGHLVPPADRVPRVVMRFHDRSSELLVSGMLGSGRALASRPAIIDVPVGDGHAVLFAINPMWRNQTHGQYGLVLNTLLNFAALDAGK